METKSGSGFNADKFQRLVAMFDSPYEEEAATAFRAALFELKKSQLKFIDQMGNSAEAEKAKKECEAVRRELYRALDLAKNKDAKAAELEGIIERLHRRISMMEEAAAAAPPAPPDEPPEYDPPEDDAPVGEWSETPSPGPVDTLSLSRSKQVFWAGLATVSLWYIGGLLSAGKPLTVDFYGHLSGWQWFWLITGLFSVGWLIRKAAIYAVSRFDLGPAAASRLDQISIVKALYVWLALVFLSYGPDLYGLKDAWTTPDPIPLAICAFLFFSGMVWTLRKTFAQYRWEGIVAKVCVAIDFLLLGATVALGRDPWSWFSNHRPWWTPHPLLGLALATAGLIATVFLPEPLMSCIIDNQPEGMRKTVLAPAILGGMFAVFLYFNNRPAPPAPKIQSDPPATHPAPKIQHKLHHHAPAPLSQLIAPAVVHASDGEPGSSDDDTGALTMGGIFAVVVFAGFVARRRSKNRKELNAARKAAHTFKATNVHGDAGFVSKSDARKRGWL